VMLFFLASALDLLYMPCMYATRFSDSIYRNYDLIFESDTMGCFDMLSDEFFHWHNSKVSNAWDGGRWCLGDVFQGHIGFNLMSDDAF
jgi:hypothetical protein